MGRRLAISALLMAMLALSAMLSGCAKTIEGTVADVIMECQAVPEGEDVRVRVTGYAWVDEDDTQSGDVYLSSYALYPAPGTADLYLLPDPKIQCDFDGGVPESVHMGDCVTISGDLLTVFDDDWVALKNCSIE